MTAVEWLETQIVKFHNWKLNPIYDENCFDEIELNKAIQQAKEKEKQQIIDARVNGVCEGIDIGDKPITEDISKNHEIYYKETFKNK